MLSQKGNELAVDEIEPLSMSTDRKRKEKKRKGHPKRGPTPQENTDGFRRPVLCSLQINDIQSCSSLPPKCKKAIDANLLSLRARCMR